MLAFLQDSVLVSRSQPAFGSYCPMFLFCHFHASIWSFLPPQVCIACAVRLSSSRDSLSVHGEKRGDPLGMRGPHRANRRGLEWPHYSFCCRQKMQHKLAQSCKPMLFTIYSESNVKCGSQYPVLQGTLNWLEMEDIPSQNFMEYYTWLCIYLEKCHVQKRS